MCVLILAEIHQGERTKINAVRLYDSVQMKRQLFTVWVLMSAEIHHLDLKKIDLEW